MSDVLLKKLGLPVVFGAALAVSITASIEPADAGLKLNTVFNGTLAADNAKPSSNAEPTLQLASDETSSDGASETPPSSDSAAPSEPAPANTSSDQPAASTEPAAPGATEAAAQPAPAPPKPKVVPANAKPLPAAGPDYYTERAKKTVAEDKAATEKPHPLQAANPDDTVVVCEGGCSGQYSAEIVYQEPHSARKTITTGEMKPTSSDAAGASPEDSQIVCEGGCYENQPRVTAKIPGGGNPVAANTSKGDWVTTVKSEPAAKADNKKSGSGDWMKAITLETKQGVAKPAAKVEEKSAEAKPEMKAEAKPEVKAEAKPAVAAPAPAAPVAEAAPAPAPAAPAVEAAAPAPAPEVAAAPAVAAPAAAPAAEAKIEAAPAPVAPEASKEAAAPAAEAPKPEVATSQPAAAAQAPAAPAAPETKAAEAKPAEPAVLDAMPAIGAAPEPIVKPVIAATPAPAAAPVAAAPAAEAPAAPQVATEGQMVPTTGEKPAAEMTAPVEAAAPATPEAAPAMDAAPAKDEAAPAKPETKAEAPAAPAADTPAAEVKVAELTKPEAPAAAEQAPVVSGSKHDPVIAVASGDPEMDAAISKARSSLPDFWAKLDKPNAGETDFSLKVAIQDAAGGEVEHFWLTKIVRKGDQISGVISNEPSTVKSVRMGQNYSIDPAKISDWMFKRNGKMVGNETMRPMLKHIPEQQAAQYRSMYETP